MNAVISVEEGSPKWLGIVAQQVAALRYGVVQMERTEKVRLDRADRKDHH